ncbi:hypothetical protein L0Z13_11285 [Burkholderia multivorans]|uniref:Bbp16 family capsid cement protein n=1 Tax=Burkholderia multivorans TaxID=87883 RepID=UPI0009E0DD7D|nr:hypothetical protein [Burkholderia multivorans]MCO1435445.1 hypothetical protein [Burkholderia multivorans]UQN59178.1 hypothetical protein L0Y94_21465 [Burkholderia multivorans]UQN67506.1 hypothetical protein L0Y92_19890 [Burkholderia multivorans]UQO04933.1 hypothetical protein L0Z13_11285 [Burkholderia multivorans]UQO23988.1 hypothetical protein L0Z34_21475 [Burkholderia multivorans]
MIIDSLLEFSRAQALTATGASTNIIDLGSDRDIGPGQPLWAVIAVQVAADNTTGDETYSIALQTDDNAAFSSPTTIATVAPAAAAMTAGARFVIGMPFANERYLRLNYTLGGTTPSVTLNAFLTDQEPASWQAYPDGIA